MIISWMAGFFAGLFGAMGLGGGGVLIIYLSIFGHLNQLTAQGINLIFFVFTSFVGTLFYSYKKLIDWKILLLTAFFGIPAAICGFYLSGWIGNQILRKIFGTLMLMVGISQIFKKGHKI